MQPLPVVSQPNNVPTLAPTVAPAPQQAPLQVQNAPAPQQTQLPVQSAPSAQPQNLPVQEQPANQQQSVSVQLPPIVTAIQTAINRGAAPATILKAIGDQNPAQQAPIQTALSRGATPQQVLTEIVQQNSGLPPNPQDAPPQHVGFIQSLVQSIARPFLRPAVSLYNAGAATVKGLEGDIQGGMQEATATRHLGYFGDVKPIMKPGLDAAGDATEIAANFLGGEGAVVAGEDLIKGAAGAAIKTGIKEGAIAGGTAGLGSSLQGDKPTFKSVAEGTLGGAAGGAVTGGVLTGLPAFIIKTGQLGKSLVNPGVIDDLTRAIRPSRNNTGFQDALKTALPALAQTIKDTGSTPNDYASFADTLATAKKAVWSTVIDNQNKASGRLGDSAIPGSMKSVVNQLGDQYGKAIADPARLPIVDGNKIASAVENAIDARTAAQNPSLAQKITQVADSYRKPFTLAQAEDYLESVNNDLHSYYAKNKVSQSVAARDPEVAYKIAEANTLREQLYSKLDAITGKDSAGMKKLYGALSNVQSEVIKKVNTLPPSSASGIGDQINFVQGAAKIGKSVLNGKFGDAAEGAFQIGAQKLLDKQKDPNFLIHRAFSKLTKKP